MHLPPPLQSEFLSAVVPHYKVADLMEDARMLEAESASVEETLDDGSDGEPSARASVRDSWNSQSTIHA